MPTYKWSGCLRLDDGGDLEIYKTFSLPSGPAPGSASSDGVPEEAKKIGRAFGQRMTQKFKGATLERFELFVRDSS